MKLYLVRHGKALSAEEDSEKSLSFEGEANLYFVGRAYRKMQLKFNLIVTSPKKRTLQTAEILAEKVLYDTNSIVQTELLTADKDAKSTLDFLLKHTDKEHVLVVGHLPNLQELIFELVGMGNVIGLNLDNGQTIAMTFDPLTKEANLDWILTTSLCKLMVT
ncbi:MAG: 2,3-bisphosphoglycerate-dependent phosphoglycerate mutase [Chlamydiae bacterium]|nr:2,3-bisphosphoglycerate-dependent phosphoglycerate mutase [Chlamydiota bacterium]